LDRFLIRVSFGYPSRDEEWGVLQRRIERKQEESHLAPVVDASTLMEMQRAIEEVTVEDSVGRYMVELATATREHAHVLVGASPRGSLALMLMARAVAAMSGRDFVVPEDVKRVAVAALAHRVTLRPEMWLNRVDSAQVVSAVLSNVPAPVTAALPAHGAPRL
jgi:MoxR-like ATPase